MNHEVLTSSFKRTKKLTSRTIKLLFCFINVKRAKLCFISFFIFSFSFTEAQIWCWGRDGNLGYKSSTATLPVATDRFGNAYVSGTFDTYLILGNDTLKSLGGSTFLIKYNSQGQLDWATNPTSGYNKGYSSGYSTVADANDNAYITGSSDSTITFGSFTLHNKHIGGFFVKYSSTGQVLWAHSHLGVALALDVNGNIGLAAGQGDSILKFNPTGTMYMSKRITPAVISKITFDRLNNIYATGGTGVCLYKFDSSGNQLWEVKATAPTMNIGGLATAVITDANGNPYITGYFKDTLCFGTDTLFCRVPPKGPNHHSATSMFLAKYSPAGTLEWVKQSTDKHRWKGTALSMDKTYHIYLAGYGYDGDSLVFGGAMLKVPNSSSSESSFIIKLDTSGHTQFGTLLENGTVPPQPGGPINELAVDSNGTFCYLTGMFQYDTVICNADTLASASYVSCYIARWTTGQCEYTDDVQPIQPIIPSLAIFPNPFTNSTTISIESSKYKVESYLELYDVMGRRLKQIEFTGNTYTLSAEGLAKGMYFIRVSDKNNNVIGTSKIVVQ
jgi:hypothetical protein